MILVAEIIFWLSAFVVFYTYVGYPLLMMVLARFSGKAPKTMAYSLETPPVTLIVAAYNEESILEEKIGNSLSLDYPAEKFNILFISDGSTDGSNEIISRYPSIKLLYEPERAGKLAAMNRAMKQVDTEIVIFSDANTLLNRDCIYNIIRHYNDESVGAVAGEKKIVAENGVAGGEGAYWKYESFLKRLDSRVLTVVGAAGELFSIRKSLYTPLKEDVIIEDFVQSLMICRKGYVVRYEPAAFATERASLYMSDEGERKTRIAAGGFQAMMILKDLLNIFHFGRLSFMYISHRVLRWTACPLALVALLISSGYLYVNNVHLVYALAFTGQLVFYLTATIGNVVPSRLFYLPYYFCFMNICVFRGFFRFLTGRQTSIWAKASRGEKI